MMNNYKISINQLADFHKGTESTKKRIVKQQKEPNSFRIAYYQLAKARIKKSIQLQGEIEPVLKGIELLKGRKVEKKRQISDKKVSIEAMEKFLKLKLPTLLKNIDFEIIKVGKKKSIFINGVEILISPDIVIKGKINGETFIGGLKLHVSKSNKFDNEQQQLVACALYKFLETEIAKDNEIVLPELCLSLDIFGNGFVTTTPKINLIIDNIHNLCAEIKQYWNVA